MTTETTSEQAQGIFDGIVTAIAISCENRDDAGFLTFVRENGLTTTNVPKGPILRLVHEKMFPDGWSVSVEYRSYDPSAPYQNEPDINKFETKLFHNGNLVTENRQQYSDTF